MPRIYVYSPSGAVSDHSALERGVAFLRARGHAVEVDPAALAREQRFAGGDDVRLAAIERAAKSGADIAMISRGGYGLSRLLPRIPWQLLAQAGRRGTRFVGFSDFTALQLGLYASCGATSWAGPALCETFGRAAGAVDSTTLRCFEQIANGADPGGVRWSLEPGSARFLRGSSGEIARGATLWGGNLAMVTSLLGTPWWPAVRGGILFLEDVGEHPYRIERMLVQLLHAGVLQQQRAILLGRFSEYRLTAHDGGYDLVNALEWIAAHIEVPMVGGLPFGHGPGRVMLPVGRPADLRIEEGAALLHWQRADHR